MAAPRLGRLQRIALAIRGAVAPATKQPLQRDTASWAIGDMAERIGGGAWANLAGEISHDPCAGHVDIVREVILSQRHDGHPGLYLRFSRWPDCMFDASGFRKLTPRADAASAADATFVRRLKRRRLAAPSLLDRLAARLERILS